MTPEQREDLHDKIVSILLASEKKRTYGYIAERILKAIEEGEKVNET